MSYVLLDLFSVSGFYFSKHFMYVNQTLLQMEWKNSLKYILSIKERIKQSNAVSAVITLRSENCNTRIFEIFMLSYIVILPWIYPKDAY